MDKEVFTKVCINFRETKQQQEKVAQKTVEHKYFKEIEKNFLTYTERLQIKKLHDQDPEEWTPEVLSLSFPALPSSIERLVKSRWGARKPETIIRYERNVMKNWDDYRAGDCEISNDLKEHLKKFANRKIVPLDEETIIKKSLLNRIEIPTPQSNVFSTIVEKERKKREEEAKKNKQLLIDKGENSAVRDDSRQQADKRVEPSNFSAGSKKSNQTSNFFYEDENDSPYNEKSEIFSNQHRSDEETGSSRRLQRDEGNTSALVRARGYNQFSGSDSSSNELVQNDDQKEVAHFGYRRVSHDQFLKMGMRQVDKLDPKEAAALKLAYRKSLENKQNEVVLSSGSAVETTLKNRREVDYVPEVQKKLSTETERKYPAELEEGDVEKHNVSTFVKQIVSHVEGIDDSPNSIRIPKAKLRPGRVYRYKDSFYDSYGQFLYRVPGLSLHEAKKASSNL